MKANWAHYNRYFASDGENTVFGGGGGVIFYTEM